MEETIKFTKEEVSQINQLRQDVGNIFVQLGQLQIEKKKRIEEVENNENQLIQQHKDLVKQEQDLFKSLNDKYGDGNYDPNTGEFTPSKTQETTSEDTKK